eukprot:scaffold7730_cov173-Ochromonas_danica.AAC.9
MQTMESKGKELLKRKNTLQSDRDKLIRLLENALGESLLPTPDSDLDLVLVENKWNSVILKALHDNHQLSLQQQQLSNVSSVEQTTTVLPDLTTTTSDHLPAPLAAPGIPLTIPTQLESDQTSERIIKQEAFYKDQISHLESLLTSRQEEVESLKKQVEESKLQYEEQVLYLQMQLQTTKTHEEQLNNEVKTLQGKISFLNKTVEEKDITVASNKEMLQALQVRLIELEPELAQAREKVSTLQIMKFEHDGLINNLRKDLKAALEAHDQLSKKSKEMEERLLKNDGQNAKVAALTEQVSSLTEEVENNKVLIQRLRNEAATNEQNHAMRTAALAAAEAQIEGLQEALGQKEGTLADLVEKISSLQTNLSSLEHTLEEKVNSYSFTIQQLEESKVALETSHAATLEKVKSQYEEQIETIKKENAKKSSIARSILSEREEEVRILSQKVQSLQDEINSGAPSERKIFEIAHLQSKRDAFNEQYKDSREVSFSKLQQVLAGKDLELAQLQQAYSALYQEVQDLRRVKAREGVNMDYLKNIVLQYMTFPLQSTEKQSLVSVIGMLLQFNPKELQEAMKATRNPAYASLPVKEVKRITHSGTSVVQMVPNNKNDSMSASTHGRSSNPANVQRSPRASMTAEEADFQEKLEKISNDILSLSVTYEDLDPADL